MPTRTDGPIRRRNVWFVLIGLVLAGGIALIAQSSAFAGQSEHEHTARAAANASLQVTVIGMGTAVSDPPGINCGADCEETYNAETASVGVTYTPAPGWLIKQLSSSNNVASDGSCSYVSDTAQRCPVKVTGPGTITITFGQIHDLLVRVDGGSGQGTVSVGRTPGTPLTCGPINCLTTEFEGTAITATATAAPGSRFDGWTGGGCIGTGTCTFTVNADTTVVATFTDLSTLTVNPIGSGTVTSDPAVINCPGDCTELFDAGTPVALTAAPAAGFRFAGWSGPGCEGTGTCNVTVNTNDVTVSAFFVRLWTLTVTKDGAGAGRVTSAPAGIDCGSDCTEIHSEEDEVVLTASAAPGSRFAGWSGGGCSGTETCTVELTADTTVTATFAPIPSASQPPAGDRPPAARHYQPGPGDPCGPITRRSCG